ncbi:SAM-dependent methyltransferase [Actinomycetospora sp. OC33-EN08]|uniref:SAM-dependent methyltransferase n=1 Tax=Actinomycetospora aurantiaca TaxID=3129233 RepID=A0ABU8MLU2_9PSEU
MQVEYYPAPPPPGPRVAGLELDAILASAADLELPNYARTVDALLGGGANFAVDRAAAAELRRIDPLVEARARANRAFVRRAVRHAHAEGIDQFLDLGCGIPSIQSVHGVVHAVNPHARVAYVDLDPVVVAHARELVADLPEVSVTWADLRSPGCVLDATEIAGRLDPSRPIALLACGVLHFVHDDLAALLAGWRELLAPGSVVAATHLTAPRTAARSAAVTTVDRMYSRGLAGLALRDPAEVGDALAVVGPVVDVVDWPHAGAGGRHRMNYLGAVGTV